MASTRGNIAKLVLVSINLVVLVLTLSLVLFASSKLTVAHSKSGSLHSLEAVPPSHSAYVAVLVFASFGALVSILGVLAVLVQSSCLYKSYVYFLGLAVLLVLLAYSAASLFEDSLMDTAREFFRSEMSNTSKILVWWQSAAMCCGAMSPRDWHNRTLVKGDKRYKQGHFPESCCDGHVSRIMLRNFQRALTFGLDEKTDETLPVHSHGQSDSWSDLIDSSDNSTDEWDSTQNAHQANVTTRPTIRRVPTTRRALPPSPVYLNTTCTKLLFRDGCFSSVQQARYRIFAEGLTCAIVTLLLFLLALMCCLERDRQHQTAALVNAQYFVHRQSCLAAPLPGGYNSHFMQFMEQDD